LRTYFDTDDGIVRAVEGATYDVYPRDTLAVVGESGSGKSVTAMSVLRLIPQPPGRIVGGTVRFGGRDLLRLSDREMYHIRGRRIAMIFQEPMTSLNPVHTVGKQIVEPMLLHRLYSRAEAEERAVELLRQVGIPAPRERMRDYPFQLSGGMRQRVMIAIALSCDPDLLIADEPTSALDVTVQLQILRLLKDLQEQRDMAVVLITHDLGVVAEVADRVAVMYAGRVVENGSLREVFYHSTHPYVEGLRKSIPDLEEKVRRLPVIPGQVPNAAALPAGCPFAPRCPYVMERCTVEDPPVTIVHHSARPHTVRCWLNEGPLFDEAEHGGGP
jgi:oligopeptide/dipeptide ABC transporter ATP-binding protein